MIPKLHYLSQGNSVKEQLQNIQNACTSGIELVRLEASSLSDKKLLQFARQAQEITSHFQTRLMLTDNFKIAKEIKADGVHFLKIKSDLPNIRNDLFSWQIVGGTANNFEECKKCLEEEVDYIALGPFKNTIPDNSAVALNLDDYTKIIAQLKSDTPILAFGEISIEDTSPLLQSGISGLIISEEIDRDFNSIRVFNKLLNASSTAEQRYKFE